MKVPDVHLTLVESFAECEELMRWLGERRTWLACDTETEGFDWWRDGLRTVQFGDTQRGWCLEHSRWKGMVEEVLRRYEGPLVFHNAKFDMHFLREGGYHVRRELVHDTRVMAHLIDERKPSGLKPRAGLTLGSWARSGEDELKLAMQKGGWGFKDVPVDLLWRYAAFDTVLTAMLADALWPQVAQSFHGLYDLEMAVAHTLTDMERLGCLVDQEYLTATHRDWELEQQAIGHTLREEWGVARPTSRPQLAARLQELGVELVQRTPSGQPKMTEDVLETIDHPIAQLAIRQFTIGKQKKTYIDALLDLADEESVVHCNINPLGARTGRMSASRPPLQQLPRQAAIRDAFVARPGRKLILADYDQIEMRLLAHFSSDPAMIQAIRRGDELTAAGYDGWDLHSANARAIFSIPETDPVPKLQRQGSKTGGFAEVYGAGVAQFAATMGVDMGTAAQFKSQYNATFPGVGALKRRIDRTLQERMPDPHLMTPYGRKHRVDMDKSYRGTNYLIQGTAADVLKDRLVAMRNAGLGEFMTLPIHDEIMLDVPHDQVDDVVAVLRQEMPLLDTFAVPLTVGVDIVDRWGDKYREG